MDANFVAALEKVFFTAMINGYAGGGKFSTTITGEKFFVFTDQEAGLKVVDSYRVNHKTGVSLGQTVIFAINELAMNSSERYNPYWVMNYWGRYPKSVIPFLKRALVTNYQNSTFNGGRGPASYHVATDPDFSRLRYTNQTKGSFEDFSGEENIEEEVDCLGELSSWEPMGWHKYQGFALFK